MSKSGMQLRKLQLEGSKKKDAILEFYNGLNVVAGASDTGKSFAYECINYALGATDIPEIPNEAAGYEWVLLEFVDKRSNQNITLKRSFLESEKANVYYIYSDIAHLKEANSETLSVSSNSKNSLSSKLLMICNCSYRNILKKSSNGETEAFTFRKFVYLMMMNETRIVQKNSPIYIGDTKRDRMSTKETASFFTMLTGLDYQKFNKPESAEVKKAHLKGAIDELTLICGDLQKEISATEGTLDNYESQQSDKVIKKIEKSLSDQRQVVQELEFERQRELSVIDLKVREKSRISDNLAKFKLLKKNYKSDIDRLDFIEQAYDYTGQLVDMKCPICHTPMKSSAQNNQIYYVALNKEKDKLKAHLLDLQETIDDFESDLLEVTQQIAKEQEKIKFYERGLEDQVKEVSRMLIEHERYLKIRDKALAIENNKKKLLDANSRILELNERIDNTKAASDKVGIKKLSDELMLDFCEIIRDLLEKWNFINNIDQSVVAFNTKANDVIVCSKTKASYGKGARAIINSSFIIAIMRYCIQHGLSHPGFVVLDSPLTTYKEKDKLKNEKNEEVDKSVKSEFFYNLSRIGRDMQIIVFDNEVPPDDIKEIAYHHFTGNPVIDRTGFVPINQ
jgi:hypothetical protein